MNARTANEVNEQRAVELLESAKKLAEQKNISISEAIDFKVSIYQKYATTENEAACWYIIGEKAKKTNN